MFVIPKALTPCLFGWASILVSYFNMLTEVRLEEQNAGNMKILGECMIIWFSNNIPTLSGPFFSYVAPAHNDDARYSLSIFWWFRSMTSAGSQPYARGGWPTRGRHLLVHSFKWHWATLHHQHGCRGAVPAWDHYGGGKKHCGPTQIRNQFGWSPNLFTSQIKFIILYVI